MQHFISRRRTTLGGLAAIMAASIVLAACGPTGEDTGDANGTGPAAETDYDVELTGSIGDGPVVGASIRVIAIDGTVLSNAVSSETADYNILVKTKGKHYPLTIEAEGGTDLTTHTAPSFTLTSASLAPRSKVVVNVTPFSTLAVAIARRMNGGLSSSNVSAALTTVLDQFNSGLTSALSSDPMTTPVDDSNLAEIVKSSEMLAEIFRRTHAALGQSSVSVDGVIDAIAADLVDGSLDGAGTGVNRRISALTIVAAAEVGLEAMVNRLEVDGRDVTADLDAIVMQLATGSNPSLTDTRPVTTQMIADVRRGIDAAMALTDTTALQTLSAALDQVSAGASPATVLQQLPADPAAALDPTLTALGSATSAELDTVLTGQSAPPSSPPPEPPPPSNSPPVISGTPMSTVIENTPYSFVPTASDADGDGLTFDIVGRPAWAVFSTATGALTGTPTSADIGTYSGITISVTDGTDTVQLAPFSIAVQAIALGSATLSWVPPTQNTDGSPLTDLAGYRVLWGQQPGSYTSSVTIMNPGITTYVVDQLAPATYYFTMTALNSSGAESTFSNEASKTIN